MGIHKKVQMFCAGVSGNMFVEKVDSELSLKDDYEPVKTERREAIFPGRGDVGSSGLRPSQSTVVGQE